MTGCTYWWFSSLFFHWSSLCAIFTNSHLCTRLLSINTREHEKTSRSSTSKKWSAFKRRIKEWENDSSSRNYQDARPSPVLNHQLSSMWSSRSQNRLNKKWSFRFNDRRVIDPSKVAFHCSLKDQFWGGKRPLNRRVIEIMTRGTIKRQWSWKSSKMIDWLDGRIYSFQIKRLSSISGRL